MLGKDLNALKARTFAPHTQEARLFSPLAFGIVIRDQQGRWPPSAEALEMAMACIEPSQDKREEAMPLQSQRDPHVLCAALLSLLMPAESVVWNLGRGSERSHGRVDYRGIWLDASAQIFLDLTEQKQVWAGWSSGEVSSMLLDGQQNTLPLACLNYSHWDVMYAPSVQWPSIDGTKVVIPAAPKAMQFDLAPLCRKFL